MSRLSLKAKTSASTLYGLALAFILGIAFFLRVYFPYDNVFAGDWVRFKWFDSWYHIRLVENLVHHFPQRINFDPYTLYPHGQKVFFAPFYDLLLGFFAWVFGAGSPSTGTIETLGAYFPAILGALVTIPVYFVGKELFNRKVGLIAAALVIILPGQFLLRSLLGFTDHHVAETLFSTLTMLFLILAVKSSKQREISFNSLLTKDWGTLKKPLAYSVLTGIALGFYLLSWVGGAIVVFTIFLYTVIQYLIDHLRGKSTDYLCIIGIPVLFIAILMIIPFLGQYGMGELQIASLIIGILTFPALSGLSLLLTRRNMKRAYYPLALALLASIGLAAFYIIAPSVLNSILDQLSWLNPTRGSLTIGEMRPLTLSMAWEEFTTSFYLALISLAVIAYLVIREGAADKTLLLTWSVIMLVATIGQNRFAYYFAINASLLTAYLSWKTATFVGAKVTSEVGRGEKVVRSEKSQTWKKKDKSSKKDKERKMRLRTLVTRYPVARYAYVTLAAAAVFFLVFYPNIGRAIDVARQASHPRQDWHDSLVWMRENTPDPFLNDDFYYELYERPANGEDYNYPESAYGVMSWWDYGHWITYIAHRIPNANPHQQGAPEAAQFFTAQDVADASELLSELGSRYIIIDFIMALHQIDPEAGIYGNFYAIIEWAGKDKSEFFETYYQQDAGKLEHVVLYYPTYYRSMCTRLYLFGGQEIVPNNSTLVVSYTEKTNRRGVKYKEITDLRQFATYGEACTFLQQLEDPSSYRIVGNNPLISPVPLEKLEHYELIYSSANIVAARDHETISEVEIFEYMP